MSTEVSTESAPQAHPDQSYPANPLGEIKLRRAKMARRPANFKWKDEAVYWRGNARFWKRVAIFTGSALIGSIAYRLLW